MDRGALFRNTRASMRPGDVVAERFTIERRAGGGGMGTIYRARDAAEGGAQVALKLLRSKSPDALSRFDREARLLAEIDHPGVVRYVAHGIAKAGEPYLAMEWLEGEDLAERLERAPLSLDEGLLVVRQAAEALGAAHLLGVVHRDVKPSNLFLVGGALDQVKVLDFGIARMEGAARGVTGTGSVLGTPGYMAPEQARGERELDARADVFSLGCVLFHCAAGKPPFDGEPPLAVLAKVLFEEAPRLSEATFGVPTDVDALVARALAKDPAARPRDGAALAESLAGLTSTVELVLPAGGRSSLPPVPALTDSEQQIVSVIAVSPGEVDEDEASDPAASTLTPEALEAPWERMAEAATRFGARFERLRDGSAAAAITGHGSATDQAAQAARCSLAMRAALPMARFALATGRGELRARLPIGEALERAFARLARAKEGRGGQPDPGSVGLDDVAAGLLGERFEVTREAGLSELHGEREPTAEGPRLLLGKPTPCVGRDRELAILTATLAECEGEGVARAVLVTGPPGVGKSRLLRELVRGLSGRSSKVITLFAEGDPLRRGAAFGVAAQIVRRLAGIALGEPHAEVCRKLDAATLGRIPAEEAPRVAAFLGELIGAALPGEASAALREARARPARLTEQIHRAFGELLTAVAAEGPVLVAIEDVHASDAPSLQALDAALRAACERPLLVIGLARPEVRETSPGLWSARGAQELRLGELSRRASERLARSALGAGAPQEVVERLAARAAGNALYLEELLRAEAAGLGAAVPETVLAMVQSRLLSLPPEARRLARAASVFGEVFWEAGVRGLLGATAGAHDVTAALSALVAREVVVRRDASRYAGQDEYAFRHALVREAAYGMLVDEDRALGHLLAGGFLERAGEADPAMLAGHFDLGGDGPRAVSLYVAAMPRALAASDLPSVLASGERAIALGVSGPRLGEVRAMQADAHQLRGELPEAERCSAEAVRHLPEGSPMWLEAQTRLALFAGGRGDAAPLEALARALAPRPSGREGGATAATEGDAASRASAARELMVVSWLARNLLALGAREAGEPLFGRMAQALEAERLAPSVEAHLRASLAHRAFVGGELTRALGEIEAAAALFERAGMANKVAECELDAAMFHLEIGADEAAVRALDRASALAERMGLFETAAWSAHHRAALLLRRGEVDEALARASALLLADPGQENVWRRAAARGLVARALLGQGDAARAEGEARRAAEDAAGALGYRCLHLATRAEALGVLGRAEEAREVAEEAMGLLTRLGGATEGGEALVRLAYAEALAASGAAEEAQAAFGAARAWLLEREARLVDPDLREALRRVPEHARLLACAAGERISALGAEG
jgi:eukaryotic-like serine/threonine-protein kinase